MANFRVVTGTMSGPLSRLGGADYEMERRSLEPISAEIVSVDGGDVNAFKAKAGDADAVLMRDLRLDAEMIAALTQCKIIAFPSVGYDNVDLDAATAAGIVVTNCPDTFIEEVADHAMSLLLGCWRRQIEQDRIVREGRWAEGRVELSKHPRLRGQTLGLIAFGNIARLTAKRAKAFGLQVLAYDPYVHEHRMHELDVEPVSDLMEMLQRSDFVSMHTPLTAETSHMLSTQHFSAMKPGAIFINTGRGPTVDEAALLDALQRGEIAYAGLDVFEQEPVGPDNPMTKLDNVILSAHVASASSRMMPEACRRAGQEIAAVLSGRRPLSPVNPQVL